MGTSIVHDDKRSASLVHDPEPQPSSLMTVIERLASNPNVDIDKIERLLLMQERWEMNLAKAEFREAMAEFKRNPPEIIKNRIADMRKADGTKLYSYNYADLEMCTTAIIEGAAPHGITHAWFSSQDHEKNTLSISCVLSRGIYSEPPVILTAGYDTSGGKNAIQAIASAKSYLEKYTLLGAFGMAAGMPDTDGNLGGLPADDRKLRLDAIKTAPDADALKKVYLAAAKAATDAKDSDALSLFAKAKNNRYMELAHA